MLAKYPHSLHAFELEILEYVVPTSYILFSYSPISTFCWADTLYDAIGFEVGKVFFNCFRCNANLLGKCSCAQLTILGEQCHDCIPTFYRFPPTFFTFYPYFIGLLRGLVNTKPAQLKSQAGFSL